MKILRVAHLLDDAVRVHFAKGLLEIAMFCHLAFGHIHKDIADLHHIIQVCFSINLVNGNDCGISVALTLRYAILELYSCSKQSTPESIRSDLLIVHK